MEFGICNIAMVPVRSDPGHRAEMVSELLYGESYSIIEQRGAWLQVQSDWDGYRGWIEQASHMEIGEGIRTTLLSTNPVYTAVPVTATTHTKESGKINLSAGSRLPLFDQTGLLFGVSGERYTLPPGSAVSRTIHASEMRNELLETAKEWLNTPYLWGGKSSFGTDCSGFVQTCCRICGIPLPRDSGEQAGSGTAVDSPDDAQGGDLAFFGEEEKSVTHTGIVAGNGLIFHASGFVRLDRLDDKGIYRAGRLTHKLRMIRDIISG